MQHPISTINFIKHNQAHMIEASAGTGKTWTIERLFIKALLERNQLSLDKFLVVTFTEAAVAELKTRILKQLIATVEILIDIKNNSTLCDPDTSGAIQRSCDLNMEEYTDEFIVTVLIPRLQYIDKDIAILTQAIQNFDSASIYTIHGFCNQILNNYQIECNIRYPFNLIKDKQVFLKDLVLNFVRLKLINNPIFADKYPQLYLIIEKILIGKNKTATIVDLIYYQLSRVKNLITYIDGKHRVNYRGIHNPDLSVLLDEDIDSNTKIMVLLSSVLEYINDNYYKYLMNNQFDFDDLIAVVANSVKNNSNLAIYIYKDYPITFIDEFQDTDELQWQVFSEIYNIKLASEVRGNIVLVGDPKQAIYSFRGADINVYLEAKRIIDSNNVLSLNENRRSHPNILNFINHLFSQESNPNCCGVGVEYSKIEAKVEVESLVKLPHIIELNNTLSDAGVNLPIYDAQVQIVAIHGDDVAEKDINLKHALTFEILTLLKTNPDLINKIAILVTTNSQALTIVDQLKKYGVPACLLKQKNIFSTATASDLCCILESVLNLADFSLMRKAIATNLFNIRYVELHNFTQDSYYLPNGESIQERFFKYRALLENNGVMSLVYALIRDISAIAQHNDIGVSNRELSNLIQLGELLNKNLEKIKNNVALLFWFKEKIKIETSGGEKDASLNESDEELIRLDNDEKQIQVITQHKSKGLEFEIVFCPYFKSIEKIDKNISPQFINYRDNKNESMCVLTSDADIIQSSIDDNNDEVGRLNYVTFTRAKSRIYIYLTQIKKNKKGEYNGSVNKDKVQELFGLKLSNANDTSHQLFNYPEIFSENPESAFKNKNLLPGVVIYHRLGITTAQLYSLRINENLAQKNSFTPNPQFILQNTINLKSHYFRQSYSSLTHVKKDDQQIETDYYVVEDKTNITEVVYRYPILNQLRGAKFGVLIHSLCESYPLNHEITQKHLIEANLDVNLSEEFMHIINEIFDYKLLYLAQSSFELSDFAPDVLPVHGVAYQKPQISSELSIADFSKELKLNSLTNKINELDFNITITQPMQMATTLKQLLSENYGEKHPYTLACAKLNTINNGYLNGFIDLFFEYQGKYYILDYKTNSLSDYTSTSDINDTNNLLLIENATQNYYIQYLLYLVAIKRYLEFKLQITDASHLIGGAIYYYVRGIFTDSKNHCGVYFDDKCQDIVAKIDSMLKNSHNE